MGQIRKIKTLATAIKNQKLEVMDPRQIMSNNTRTFSTRVKHFMGRLGMWENLYPSATARFPLLRDLMVQQANRFLQFFFSADKNDYVDQIVLAGGCSGIEGVDQLIEQRIGTPTVIADPFASMSVSSDIPTQRLKGDGSAMMISCGLAMRGADL